MKKKLGEVCRFYSGTGFPVKYQGKGRDELAFYKVGDIANNVVKGNTYLDVCNNYISRADAKEIKGTIVPKDTVVFAKIGEALKLNRRAITSSDCLIDNNAMGIAPIKDELRIGYFFYFMRNVKMQNLAESTTVPSVRKRKLEKLLIEIPSLSVQEKIEAKLDAVTSIIIKRKQELELLDNLIKARFVEMFGNPETNPYGWKKETLGTVCDVRDGTHDSPKYCEIGYPLVTSKNVTGGCIDLTTCNSISEEAYNQINERSKVDWGDIIMPMIGTVGKPVIVNIEPNFAIKNVALIKFPTQSPVRNIYIQALLESDYFDRTVISKVRGGTQKFIALGDIRRLEILIPDTETQKEFATFVAQVDKSKVVGLIENIVAMASRIDGYQCAA